MKSSEKHEPTETENEDAPDHGALGAFLAERAIQIGFLACLVGGFGLIFTSGGEEKPPTPRIVQTAQGTRSQAIPPAVAPKPAVPVAQQPASALRRPGAARGSRPVPEPAADSAPSDMTTEDTDSPGSDSRPSDSDRAARGPRPALNPPPRDEPPASLQPRPAARTEPVQSDPSITTELAEAQQALAADSPYTRVKGIEMYETLMLRDPDMYDGMLNRIAYYVQSRNRITGTERSMPTEAPEPLAKTAPDVNEALRIIRERDLKRPGGARGLRVNWDRTDLRAAELGGIALPGASLVSANLAFAKLAGADLSGARLTGAMLAFANLSDANLSGADLAGAELKDAVLAGTDLTAVRGLTQEQLDRAITNDLTKVPEGLVNPEVARQAENIARLKAEQEEMRKQLAQQAEARKAADAKAAAEKAEAEKAAADKAAARKAAEEKAAAEKAAAEAAASKKEAFDRFMRGEVSAARNAGPAALKPSDLEEAVRAQALHDLLTLEASLAREP